MSGKAAVPDGDACLPAIARPPPLLSTGRRPFGTNKPGLRSTSSIYRPTGPGPAAAGEWEWDARCRAWIKFKCIQVGYTVQCTSLCTRSASSSWVTPPFYSHTGHRLLDSISCAHTSCHVDRRQDRRVPPASVCHDALTLPPTRSTRRPHGARWPVPVCFTGHAVMCHLLPFADLTISRHRVRLVIRRLCTALCLCAFFNAEKPCAFVSET